MKNPLNNRQISLFHSSPQKGSAEWGAFNAVRGDRTGAFQVKKPEPQQPQRGTVTPARRYPNATPQTAFFRRSLGGAQ